MTTASEPVELPSWADLLPVEARSLVARCFVDVSLVFGQGVFEQGDAPDAYYVVRSGRVRVLFRDGDTEVPLALLGPGAFFGEEALLRGSARTASVRASEQTVLGRLDGSVFRAVLAAYPDVLASFDTGSASLRRTDLIRRQPVFRGLPAATVQRVADRMVEVTVRAGECVFAAGDDADGLYVVADGRFAVEVPAGDASPGRQVRVLRVGELFGELGLLDARPRTASIRAVEPGSVLRLDAVAFRELCQQEPSFAVTLRERQALYVLRDERAPAQTVAAEPVEPVEQPPIVGPHNERIVRPQRVRRRLPVIRQVDEADCGAACLAMVCRAFGHDVSMPAIRHAGRQSTDGITLAGLVDAGKEIGLDVEPIKSSADRLAALETPLIIHWQGYHWVVIDRVDARGVHLNDPALGRRRLSIADVATSWDGYAAIVRPTGRLAEAPRNRLQLGWVVPYLRPHRATFAVVLLLALIGAALEMTLPVFAQRVVDGLLAGDGSDLVYRTVGELLIVLALLTVGTLGQRRLLAAMAVRLDADTVGHLTSRLLRLPMRYFEARRTGDIQRRLGGMRQVRDIVVTSSVRTVTSLAQVLAAAVILFVYSWQLGLLFVATAPLYAGLTWFSRRWLRPVFDSLEEGLGRYSSQQIDAVRGIETVKAMGAEDLLAERLRDRFGQLQEVLFRSDLTVMTYEAAVLVVTLGVYALFLAAGALEVLHHHLTIGQLVAVNALVLFANGPLVTVLDAWDQAQLANVLLGRVQDVFEAPPEQRDATLAPAGELTGGVRLDGVCFSYDNRPDRPILVDIDLDVPAGATVAFVGRSGSGKSTLAKCLAGLVVPTAGRIEFDGVDVATLDLRSLRQRIGVVLQQPYLFDDTIAANIAFGDGEPDADRVRWAADVAAADEFCQQLPLGYQTRVGESGLRLSGGQAQRISIARAVYHRPPVVILDEATSALDAEAERAVKTNLDVLLSGRTSFVVAHRLSTIRDADLICVLEKGRIVERGSHEQLIARRGLYAYLVAQQLD